MHELTRGVPTGYAAPPLNKEIAQGNDPPPVWPHAQGRVRGYALKPLYKSVPRAARELEARLGWWRRARNLTDISSFIRIL